MADPIKILLVDSDRYRRVMLRILTKDARLRSLNIEYLQARDGLDALAQVEVERPDMLISELLLPRLSGFELVRKIRKTIVGRELKILLVTGLARDMTSINVLRRSFGVHLQVKPFTPWDFALNVQKLIAAPKGAAPRRKKQDSGPVMGQRKTQPSGAFPEDETDPGLRHPKLVDIAFDVPGLRERDRSDMTLEPTPTGSLPRRSSRGNIARHPLPELLLDAMEKRLSGTLALRAQDAKKVIYLLAGRPIYVQSNLRRETIGQTLVNRGALTAEQNSATLTESKRAGVPYGQALVQLGLMTGDKVKQELLANIRAKVQSSLDWNRGHWLFVEDRKIGGKVPRCVLDPVPLVFEGLKEHADPEKSLQRMIRNVNLIVDIPPRIARYREAFCAVFGREVLDNHEQGMTINDLAGSAGSPQVAMLQLDMMLRCGLARVRHPDASVHDLPADAKETSDQAVIVDEAPILD